MTCFPAERDMKVNAGQGVFSVVLAAKVGACRHLVLLMLLLLAGGSGWSQYRLRVVAVDSNTVARGVEIPSVFRSREACEQYVATLPGLLAARGYATASVDSLQADSAVATIHLFLGERYEWKVLRLRGVEPAELEAANIRLPVGGKAFEPGKVEALQRQLLDHYSNNGFPFAVVRIDSLVLDANRLLTGVLVVEKGLPYKMDSLSVKGGARISEKFLHRYLDLPRGSTYDRRAFESVSLRLRELPFLVESKPWQLRFGGDGAVLDLFLEPRKASQVNVLVGLLPTTNADGSNRFQVSGEATLNLRNALGGGETIGLNWQQLQVKSPRLNLLYEQPYLFGSAFGISTRFDLFKKDSSFVNINMELGLQYALSSRQTGKVFLQLLGTNLVSVDTNRIRQTKMLPVDVDRNIVNLGVDYELVATNYRRNPRRGWELNGTVTAGTRKIRRSNAVLDIKDPGFDYASLYDTLRLKSYQFRMRARVARYLPVGRQGVVQLLATAGWLQSPSLFRNELFQLGGYKLLRGFDEESLFASRFMVNTVEFRYLAGINSYFFAFADLGFTGNPENPAAGPGTFEAGRFMGSGLGMAFETTAGFFNISLAVGKRGGEPFAFRQSKIHLGYVSYF